MANDVLQNHYLFGIMSAILLWGALNLLQGRRNEFLLLVGDASYSIYIFHSVILEYGMRLMRKTGLTEPDTLTICVCTDESGPPGSGAEHFLAQSCGKAAGIAGAATVAAQGITGTRHYPRSVR